MNKLNKRVKILIILAAVLVVLAAAFLLWRKTGGFEGDLTEGTMADTYLVPALGYDASRIELTVRRDAEAAETGADAGETVTHLVLEFSASDKQWHWTEHPDVPISDEAVSLLTTALDGAATLHRLTDVTDAKLTEYGLTAPYLTARFTLTDGSEREIRVGICNSFNGLYYLNDASDERTVYLVDPAVPGALDVTVLDLIRLDTFDSVAEGKYTSVTCEKDGNVLVYTYYPSGNPADYTDAYRWYLSVNGGKEMALGDDMVSALENVLTYGYLSECVSYEAADAARFGLENPARLTVKYKYTETVSDQSTGASSSVTTDRSYVLLFGALNDEGQYYVRTGSSALTYLIAYSGTYEKLFDGAPDVIRPTELVRINNDRLTGCTITVGDRKIEEIVTHTDSETTYRDAAGVLLYADDFLGILEQLSALKATSNVAYFEAEGKGQTADGSELISFDFTFSGSGVTAGRLSITRYNDSYCRVSFLDRNDQLISNSDAEALRDAVSAFFH